jgi:hypothetical protein
MCSCFALSTLQLLFEGVKVEATGKEKIEYLIVSFLHSHHQEQESLVASEMAAV